MVLMASVWAAAVPGVSAQDGGPAAPVAPSDAGVMAPPELVGVVEAVYPEEARALGIEGTVGLDITLDESGRVTAVDVREPLGHGLDEAARSAALGFQFKPATRNGQPIPARVRYPFVFRLPPAVTAGVLAVRVTREGTPLANAAVELTGPDGAMQVLSTDAQGTARSGPLSPGAYVATAMAPDDPGKTTVNVEIAGAETPLDLALPPRLSASVVDVTVRGQYGEGQRLQRSAEAVNVIDTRRAKQQTSDLGEVLARTQGISIRREGGLGSSARVALNGLSNDQVRLFLDGVPLDLAGYLQGVPNVPVNLIERVEVYRGVVPVRFGADALGGALNLVTDVKYESHLAASYQVGSFGTHRATAMGRYRHEPTGIIVGATSFLDYARNDYRIDVKIADQQGRLSPASVKRFHDAYRAYGVAAEVGVVDKPWAQRLILQGVTSGYHKELQHNVVMTVPYGEVEYGERMVGANLRYDVALGAGFELETLASYAHRTIDFVDDAEWVYNWRGRRIQERRVPGEIDSDPTNQTNWQHGAYGRALLSWKLYPAHAIRLSVAPNFTSRTGNERIQADPTARDPLTAERKLTTLVSGLEYEINLFDDRLANIVFLKQYDYWAKAEEPLPGGLFRDQDRQNHSQGIGDSLRFRVGRWLYLKGSYEYATRLPRPDEVFGDAILVLANLNLEPEVSHNANIGPRLELRRGWLGQLTIDVNGFLRDSDKLIVLLGNDQVFKYQNVYRAVGRGVENMLSWESKGRWVALDGSMTWQKITNESKEGTFASFKGDRIPNRPYFFASWGARLRFANLPGDEDTIEPFYIGRWVHEFFRGWESQGLRSSKQVVDAQVSHNLGVTYTYRHDAVKLGATFEAANLTDAKLYDNFGVQRPGRGFYLKLTGEI